MTEHIVPEETEAQALTRYLKKSYPVGYIRKLFRKNGIRVNGVRAKEETEIRGGDRLTFYFDFEKRTNSPSGSRLPEILYDDDEILVLDKPAGLAVHGGKGSPQEASLIGLLEARGVPAILVHRLDKETSGCLLLARTPELAHHFTRLFAAGEVRKEYLALVRGVPKPAVGAIYTPLPDRNGRPAPSCTKYRVAETYAAADVSLVEAFPETGRLHQIRIHLAGIGHPVIGDRAHGDFAYNREFKQKYGSDGLFLHSARLTLNREGHDYIFEAPLPAAWRSLMDLLSQK